MIRSFLIDKSHNRNNSTEQQREDYEDDIISIIRAALVDDEPNVRTAAAQAFDVLQEELGTKAIDQTIPTLLEALRQPGKGSGTALQALKEVMNVRMKYLDLYISSMLCHTGPGFDCLPRSHTYFDRHSYDRLQCSRAGVSSYGGRHSPEQETDGYSKCPGESFGRREHRRGASHRRRGSCTSIV